MVLVNNQHLQMLIDYCYEEMTLFHFEEEGVVVVVVVAMEIQVVDGDLIHVAKVHLQEH